MRKSWMMALAVLLIATTAVFAQNEKKKKGEDTSRTVQGTVSTAEDTPVVGAVVKLKNTKSLQIRSFITKENGSYYFHQLSPDVDYELTAEYQGASSGAKTLSSFDSRREAIINLKLNKK